MKLAASLIVLLLAGCASAPANPYLACGSAGPDTYYFPEGTFAPYVPPPRPGYVYKSRDFNPDPEARESYSFSMNYLELPSLTCGPPPADETYRLVWLRSFHPEIAIQLDRSGNSYSLDVATSNGIRLSGKPLKRTHRQLTKDEWSRITAGLQKIDFWSLPANTEEAGYFVQDGKNEVTVVTAGKDGARWIIEGRADRYHVIDRWSDADDAIAVGRIFIELAQLTIPEDDIY